MLLRNLALIYIVLATIGLVAFSATHIKDSPKSLGTVVCGAYISPNAVMGIPTNLVVTPAGVSLITFRDRYVLTTKNVPSLFLGKKAVISLEENKVKSYALVKDKDFHPCPE